MKENITSHESSKRELQVQRYTPMRHSIHDVEHAIPIYLPSSLLYFNTARTNSPSEVGSAEEFPPTDESVGTCTWRGMPGSLGTSSVSEVMLRSIRLKDLAARGASAACRYLRLLGLSR